MENQFSNEKQQRPMIIPDGQIVTDEDNCSGNSKFGPSYESSTTDSGFISSGNLIVSGEIQDEEDQKIEQAAAVVGVVDDDCQLFKTKQQDSNYMRLDSGVDICLTESFSSLSLKYPGLNDLDKGCPDKFKETPPVITTTSIDDAIKQKSIAEFPWNVYFEQDEDGDTPLHLAIVQGFVELVIAMIRAAPHPQLLDTLNDDAQAPIHLAVATRQSRIVRWLIVAGAKSSPRNSHGDSPLHLAARNGDVSCCRAITDPVQHQEREALALSYPQQPYQPLSLDQWNYEGQTCVHVAAINGHVEILRHLVWYGADINARDGCSGYTALHYTVEKGDEKLLNFLLNECVGLDAEALTYGGRSALQLGCKVPATFVQILRARGAESPYTSDEESDSDSEVDMMTYENTKMFIPNLVNASA